MKFQTTQTQKQNQKQVYSQHQIKELQLLEMSSDELSSLVERELENNPFLEMDENYFKSDPDFDLILNYIQSEETLTDVLMHQLHTSECEDERLVEALILLLDSNGYLNMTLDEICRLLNTDLEAAENALETLREFEPYGIGAYNLKDCLILQLIHCESVYVDLAIEIIENELELLAANKMKQLAVKLNEELADVLKAVALIRTLDPKPGARYSSSASPIEPDVLIKNNEDELCVELKDRFIYHLQLSTIVLESEDDTVKELRKKYEQSAQQLIHGITRRCSTLLNVMAQILIIQEAYFLHQGDLKPMSLKMLSSELGLNESTISRCIKGKTLEFDGQFMEIKQLFSAALKSGESNQQIMDQLIKLIKHEQKEHPYSDQEIMLILKDEGVEISRSAIAKYRKILNIPPAYKRKDFNL